MGLGISQGPAIVAWVGLANVDPSLTKSPGVKMQTLALLNDIRNLEAFEKRASDQFREVEKKNKPVTSSSSDNSRRPPKFPQQEYWEARNKLQMEMQKQRSAIQDSVRKRIAAIRALENTPEGRQFAMPFDSKFYQALQSPNDPEPKTVDPANRTFSMRVEVVSQTPDGIFAYKKEIVKKADGSTPKDAEGNYLFEADRSKTIIITDYPDSVSLGDSLFMEVQSRGQKMIHGQPYSQYTCVKKR